MARTHGHQTAHDFKEEQREYEQPGGHKNKIFACEKPSHPRLKGTVWMPYPTVFSLTNTDTRPKHALSARNVHRHRFAEELGVRSSPRTSDHVPQAVFLACSTVLDRVTASGRATDPRQGSALHRAKHVSVALAEHPSACTVVPCRTASCRQGS